MCSADALLEERHQEAKPNKDHDVDVLKHRVPEAKETERTAESAQNRSVLSACKRTPRARHERAGEVR